MFCLARWYTREADVTVLPVPGWKVVMESENKITRVSMWRHKAIGGMLRMVALY